MEQWDRLEGIITTLMGPNGCPWDREQTLSSLLPCLIEEASEVVDAIQNEDPHEMLEEIGDLLFVCIFLAKIGEKNNQFTLDSVLKSLNDKLVRRHPHVFGCEEATTSQEVMKVWEQVKKEEKGGTLSPVPDSLSSLARGLKLFKRWKKEGKDIPHITDSSLESQVWDLILKAHEQKVDLELSFRAYLKQLEKNVV